SSIMRVFLCVLCLVLSENIFVNTLCKPRETLVEVEHEFPEAKLRRVVPSCVLLQRCGGCCSDEAMLCVSVSTHTTVMQVWRCNDSDIILLFFSPTKLQLKQFTRNRHLVLKIIRESPVRIRGSDVNICVVKRPGY
uniref:Uncharacterized protein n=1 Tax=Cyprinus carpio TaxID=7962 RepID=A0A8C1FLJ7_CYPCA